MLRYLALPVLLVMAVLVVGCGGGALVPKGSVVAVWPAGGTIVNNDIDASRMLSWDNIKSLPAGTVMYVRVNRSETEVRAYQIRYNGVEESGGERLVDCTALGELTIGAGDSGAPIVTADGRLVAVLCYGVTGDPKSFMARWAGDVETVAGDTGGTRSGFVAPAHNYQTIEPVRFISGISQSAAARMGRDLPNGYVRTGTALRSRSMAGSRSGSGFGLISGQSVCANEISGDLMTGGAIGAYSFSANGRHFIFGHSYTQEGETAIPITIARTVMMINSTSVGTMKEAEPFGAVLGTASADYHNGVVVDDLAVKRPATLPVDVSVSINGGELRKFHHDVTSHNGNALEQYFITAAVFIPIDHVVDKITGGTASAELQITLPDGSVKDESFALPDPQLRDQTSSDITTEVSNRVTQLLKEDVAPGTSPAAISLTVSVTDRVAPQVSIRLWDPKGFQYSPTDGLGAERQFNLSVGTYKLQAWVAGWQNATASWTVSDDGLGVATKTDEGISCLAEGQAELAVTITNNDTGETQNESVLLQVYY